METTHKTRQDTREELEEPEELASTDELMAEVDALLEETADVLERVDAVADAPAPSMVDIMRESARADMASIDRVGGQKSNTSNAAAWTIGGRVD